MNLIFNNGANLDTRPPEEQAKDWHQKEMLAAAAPVQWVEKPQASWRQFPIFNQDGSGSCVMQTQCKELGIMRQLNDGTYVHFSVADGYQRRANKPDSGMGAIDARTIAQQGITVEVLAPSQNMSDAQLDAAVIEPYKRQVGAVFAVPNYLALPTTDIDAIASTIQATGKGVMVWFYFLADEWTNRPAVLHPDLDLSATSTLRHSVTAVDFTLQGNEKCLIIEDSWGPGAGIGGQRVITESFFKARNWYAGYLVNFKFQQAPGAKPKHTFNVDLALNDTSDEVRALQDCLRFDGEFPANADSTGFYGPITKKAVGDYQLKHGVLSAPTEAGYGRCGPKTRATLNVQFS
jgi:hypothetical protein